MATLRKRGHKWQVQIRRRHHPAISRSFHLRSDALAWARQKELELDRCGLATEHKALGALTVAAVVTRYRDEVVPRKRGADRETIALNAFLRRDLARVNLNSLTPGVVAKYIDARLTSVRSSSVNREIDILRHAFEVARRDWKLPIADNPFAIVFRPMRGAPRSRRLEGGEWERLNTACRQCRNHFMTSLVEMALETGMRRGELLNARWHSVPSDSRTLLIPVTKSGHARTIPLSRRAAQILSCLRTRKLDDDDRLFAITENGVKMAWKRLVKRAGISNLRFHDLRHEAVSRFFERGLSVPEVALISGHRDVRMLFRYTHPRPEDIVEKLG